jgi:mannose-6-phosphate isomerase-like protein (cupin superfamily)
MDVVNRNAVVAFTTKDTSTIREILAPRNSGVTRQSLAEATLPPGAATQAHLHPQTEELYYILQGEALMAVEGERRAVGPGDAIAILPGQRHQIRNTGAGDLVFLCCCVPAYEDADTVMCEPLLSES